MKKSLRIFLEAILNLFKTCTELWISFKISNDKFITLKKPKKNQLTTKIKLFLTRLIDWLIGV
jgi:hypothetical protein